ncbi:MAG: glycosyltransferase, partial [Candidatus Bathyarchaeia archaeon]
PDFPPPYTLSAGNLQIPTSYQRRVKLIGPILPVRPEELPSREQIRKKLGLSEDKPLIFAPISGPLKERAYFMEILQKIFPEFPEDYQVVMSLGYPNSTTELIQRGNLTIYGWVPNRFEYLKACDLVIARAGHGTLTQSICYGKPLILVPTPNHTEQLNNAKRAVELGIAKAIKQEDLSKEALLATVQEMLESNRFQERAKEIQEDVLELNALETAIQTITGVAEEEIRNSSCEGYDT